MRQNKNKNSISITHKAIAEEWDYELNKGLTPDQFTKNERTYEKEHQKTKEAYYENQKK